MTSSYITSEKHLTNPRQHPWFGWLLVLCINLAEPFSFIHNHEQLNSEDLARHLQRYHADHGDLAKLGWHFHTELPPDHGESPPPPHQERTAPTIGVESEILLRNSTDSLALFDTIAFPSLVWHSEHLAVSHPQHFFDGFASSLALPVRLGVMRV